MEPVKESVTNDFSWIRDEAFQEMGGRDYEDQTDFARCIEDVARGILRKLGLPTETEANLDLDVELPGDPVDLCRAIWDEATGMMIWGLAASPFCARRILHLARAVEQWHETAGTNQLRRVALGSETGSSFTEMTRQGPTQVTEEAFGTWTGDSVRNEGVKNEQLDAIEEEITEGSALLFCNEGEKQAIVNEIHRATKAGEGLCPACRRVLQSEPGHTCERCLKVILPTTQPQTHSCSFCQWSICFDCRLPQKEQKKMSAWYMNTEMVMERIGGTRLHLAAQEGDVLGLKSLLTPDTNINCRDFCGKTPLHSLVQFCTMQLGSGSISAPSWSWCWGPWQVGQNPSLFGSWEWPQRSCWFAHSTWSWCFGLCRWLQHQSSFGSFDWPQRSCSFVHSTWSWCCGPWHSQQNPSSFSSWEGPQRSCWFAHSTWNRCCGPWQLVQANPSSFGSWRWPQRSCWFAYSTWSWCFSPWQVQQNPSSCGS